MGPNMLKAKFHSCEAGWIFLTISCGEHEHTVHISVVLDPFPDFICWLESLIKTNTDSKFYICGEGESWELLFNNDYFILLDTSGKTLIQCESNNLDIVKTFYEAFYAFIMSDDYIPKEWGEMATNGDVIERNANWQFTQKEILEFFLDMDNKTLIETEHKLNPSIRISFRNDEGNGVSRFVDFALNPDDKSKTFGMIEEPDYIKLPNGFEEWERSKRKDWLQEYMDEMSFLHSSGGSKLRELRSFIIERALKMRTQTD